MLAGWRGLGRFWAAVLTILAIGAGVLQMFGPPSRSAVIEAGLPGPQDPALSGSTASGPKSTEHGSASATLHATRKPTSTAKHPGRDTPGPVADPDPAMLEAYAATPTQKLPRISIDGRMPMSVYAAGFDPTTVRPRVGILVAGIGMGEAASLAAIKDLPTAVTLAISPYAGDIDHLLEVARMSGHEYLLSIPTEPQGYPVNDPDDRYALMSSLTPAENLTRLRVMLARLTGYVGVTNALGQMHGERFAGVPDQLDAVLEELAHRGLLFVDARIGQRVQGLVWNRPADVMIDDDPVDVAALNQRLDALTRLALEKGSALGIVSVPRPVTLERVAAWSATLLEKGLALAPVSALVLSPVPQDAEK